MPKWRLADSSIGHWPHQFGDSGGIRQFEDRGWGARAEGSGRVG